MGLRIQERENVVKGAPVVQLSDDLFWFGKPGLLLFLVHFVLFQVNKTNTLICSCKYSLKTISQYDLTLKCMYIKPSLEP